MASEGYKSTRLAEFAGLLCFALALMLLVSLATYHPHDPAPFFKAGARSRRATSSAPSALSWPSC